MALGYLLSADTQFIDSNGKPLEGGKLIVCRSFGSKKYQTFKDFKGGLNPLDVPLDSRGMCVLIAEDTDVYDVYCYDKNNRLQWKRSNVAIKSSSPSSTHNINEVKIFFSNDEIVFNTRVVE
jgi:hypothetical protein